MAQLCQRQAELEQRRARVTIISFSAPPYVRTWLQETGAPFQVLLDSELSAYRRYGLERSLVRTLSPRTVLHYTLNWYKVPLWRYGQEDVTQLGGNFIVDADGKLLLIHRSSEPVDRPTMDQLFAVLDRPDGSAPKNNPKA